MANPLDKLKDRIIGKRGAAGQTELTFMLDMAREFGCLGEIIGRDYEIRDKEGKLMYTIRQKPMAIKQLNTLLKEFEVLKKIDQEKEKSMWGGKTKGKRLSPKKPQRKR